MSIRLETQFLKFGYAKISSGPGVQQLVASQVGTPNFQSIAEKLVIVSSSAEDSLAGIGARSIAIFGLDANYKPIDEIVTLNGLTPISTANSYLRVYRSYVVDVGRNGFEFSNSGVITFRTQISNLLVLQIDAIEGQTLTSQYTIPYGMVGVMFSINLGASEGRSCKIRLKQRLPGNNKSSVVKLNFELYQSIVNLNLVDSLLIDEKNDIYFTVENLKTGETSVSVSYILKLQQKQNG